jgi:hypothetical protein
MMILKNVIQDIVDFKRKMNNGQRFEINGMEFICIETHAYFQTRTDEEESDIDVGSSYYIVRNTSTGKLHRIPFQKIIEKEKEIIWKI